MMALIGKNGTGKTQVLARLATALSGWVKDPQASFEPHRPRFRKVIAVSYSIFDEFERPDSTKTFSYVYSEIKDAKGDVISSAQLRRQLNRWLKRIKELNRTQAWKQALEALGFGEERLDFARLSSGQRLVTVVLANLLANIDNESLLLLDEPELHLHPGLDSKITQLIYGGLRDYNSLAVISTHSPRILQHIPAHYVRVLQRIGDQPLVRPLSMECFGENLNTITHEVFGAEVESGIYQDHLAKLAHDLSFDQVLTKFEGRLGLNARLYLAALYSDDNAGDNK